MTTRPPVVPPSGVCEPAAPDDHIAVYRVLVPIVRPIRAEAGTALAVWPSSATHTLAVCRIAPGYPVVRYRWAPTVGLFAMIEEWKHRGVIAPMSPW